MSYSIKLKAFGGKLEIVGDGPHHHVPDGEFTVNGHEDANGTSITVTRLDPGQQVAIQATGFAPKQKG